VYQRGASGARARLALRVVVKRIALPCLSGCDDLMASVSLFGRHAIFIRTEDLEEALPLRGAGNGGRLRSAA